MQEYKFTKFDFDNPSLIEKFANEIVLSVLGGIYYKPICEKLSLQGREKVLDFGCGNGIGSKYIARRLPNGRLICLDTSNYWLKKAKKRLRNFNNIIYEQKSITETNIAKGSLDVINIFYVLHDVEPKMREEIVVSLAEKLEHNGKLYINEPTKYNHGIAIKEIHQLMNEAGLTLRSEEIKKYKYWGEFQKA